MRGLGRGSGSAARVTPNAFGGAAIAFTPSITWTTSTFLQSDGRYIKLPGLLLMWVGFTVNAAGASGLCSITLPNGYAANPVSVSQPILVGTMAQLLNVYPMMVRSDISTTAVNLAANVTPLNSGAYTFFGMIPTTT